MEKFQIRSTIINWINNLTL